MLWSSLYTARVPLTDAAMYMNFINKWVFVQHSSLWFSIEETQLH